MLTGMGLNRALEGCRPNGLVGCILDIRVGYMVLGTIKECLRGGDAEVAKRSGSGTAWREWSCQGLSSRYLTTFKPLCSYSHSVSSYSHNKQ